MSEEFSIRFASGDEDVKRLFHFLVHISIPSQLAPVNAMDAVTEVNRIVYGASSGESFAVIAEINGEIVGALGIIKTSWWYNNAVEFLTDRFFFTFPALHNKGVGAALIAQASAISTQLGIDLIIHGKPVRRNKQHGRGVCFVIPTVIHPEK